MVVAYCHVEAKAYSANNHNALRAGYVKLGGVAVWQASWAGQFPNLRGVNTILVDPYSCSVKERRHYDTWLSDANSIQLRDYLTQLSPGSILVGVSADEPTTHLSPALSVLGQLGVNVRDVNVRGAFAFIAQKGYPAKTVLRKVLTEAEAFTNQPQFQIIIRGRPMLYTALMLLIR